MRIRLCINVALAMLCSLLGIPASNATAADGGHPTITLPGGRTDAGVSIAFQLVAPHMKEEFLFRGAVAFQRVTDWHRAHPKI